MILTKRHTPAMSHETLHHPLLHWAQCSKGWCRVSCDIAGVCRFVKIISNNYPQVFYKVRQSSDILKEGITYEADCSKDRNRAILSGNNILNWYEPLPGTIGATTQDYVCR